MVGGTINLLLLWEGGKREGKNARNTLYISKNVPTEKTGGRGGGGGGGGGRQTINTDADTDADANSTRARLTRARQKQHGGRQSCSTSQSVLHELSPVPVC